MKAIYFIFFFFVNISYTIGFQIPNHILPDVSADDQQIAAQQLIIRAVGVTDAHRFVVKVDKTLNFRSFELSKSNDGHILIAGSDGVSVAKAFHYYLKYYLSIDLNWVKATADLSKVLDLPNVTLSSTSASSFIYYQNVCTWSYSFAWWDWSTWRRHVDWMAMMGITLTIAPTQEFTWYDLYKKFNLTDDEINEHFAGPAFQAWQRMGNIRGWGGPLPETYRRKQFLLQKQILKAERELGISVALPAFAGHLPRAMKRIYPTVNFSMVDKWNRFPDQYCCSLFLDPNEPLFNEIGTQFLQQINEAYGSNHIYFADPFNEIFPRLAETNYINTTAHHIYASMRNVDANAIWLLQGWMFLKGTFWTNELIEAFLTAVPKGNLLVLDLHSELFPQYERTHSYYGQPFIWCMLHNFGGTLGMHGSAENVNTRISQARNMPNSTMVGVGITPEGIHQNYVMYALAMERAWVKDQFDLDDWFSYYADVTYGAQEQTLRDAWKLLQNSVYHYFGPISLHGKYTIVRRPSLNLTPFVWYNTSDVHQTWNLLLGTKDLFIRNYDAYTHHLVDITRQYLQILGDQLYMNLVSAYKKKNLDRFQFVAKHFNLLFSDLEEILATNEQFLLGPWLESAKKMADTKLERQVFEMNARNQITVWGPTGQIVDYAAKQWSGLVKDYYHPRWKLFLNMLEKSLRDGKQFNNNIFKQIVSNEIENPFTTRRKVYPVHTVGDSFQVSKRIFDTWNENFSNSTFLHYCRLTQKNIYLDEN